MTITSLKGTSDDDLKHALEDANIPTLLAVIAQITGDASDLTRNMRPSRSLEGLRHISEGQQAEIRQSAFELFRKIRNGDIEVSALPNQDTLHEMLSAYVAEPVGKEYVPMFLEDMGFNNSLETHLNWKNEKPDAETLNDNHVVIIGGGLSGICAAIHLQKAGIPYTIFEKNPSVGGTWYENTYPHCGVDTPNHFYSFSFEPNYDWSAYYSKQPELISYIRRVADKYRVNENTEFGVSLKSATYDEGRKCWNITLTNEDGSERHLISRFLISAVGQLNRASIPDFKGKDEFEGPSFHSANWQSDVDLKGKNVVVVGTGASAMQFCPAIADSVKSLTVLQRTPHWIRMLPDYHKTVSAGKKWLLKHIPFYQNWYRFRLFWSYGDGVWESLHYDPNWPDAAHSLNAENARHRKAYIQNLSDALDGDEELLKKVVPDFPPFAKRMLIDNHWCEMLKKDNVELVTEGVSEIRHNGIVDAAGDFHQADVIIYATGFKAGEMLGSMEIIGRDGINIHKKWGTDARAYMGMTAPDFPNFFMFYGPNTNLAHGGSLIFHIECQSRYIAKMLMQMIDGGYTEVEVREDVHDLYNDKVDAEHNSMVWTHPGVNSWYKNDKGRIVVNSPWRLVDYWSMTHEVNMSDYKLQG
ncbi:FAD-dependent oxidoreductase [Sneathiella sp. P13V-1]|uniref:flavin-containing monooxygenase n=1 Tax=Sneathiella sp. P13V-1 TaxID=2697366 RepID=UPI00187B3E2B|nr:NAD(P)/FAD-dependent oxidoreductase [Sneathiella sp. P13V-1]MBE7637494.1 FAD-dependent oxidoreductase [Sneathiella sp. P13V-1]